MWHSQVHLQIKDCPVDVLKQSEFANSKCARDSRLHVRVALQLYSL